METSTGGPGGGVGKPERVGGPGGEIGGPGGDGMGGPGQEDGPLGAGGGADGNGCPVVPEGGPHGEPFEGGTDPKIRARFTGFPQMVGRPNVAGDPVCMAVCGGTGA